jgi:hypothetical protein
MSSARWVGFLFAGVGALSLACSIAVRRDLSAVPAGQVGFDDMCGLQEYFDALEIKSAKPPQVVNALDLEGASGGKRVRGGRERFAFESDFQLKHVRRILNENWRRLPDAVATADKIEIEVKWSEKAGAKRVLTDEDAELTVAGETSSLPYHVCLSEMLYGEPLYRQRRVMWGLPLPAVPGKSAVTDAGAPASDGALEAPGADAAPAARPDR